MSVRSARSESHERRLLERAQAGDERAFRQLVEPHRTGLRAHSYRMLGSVDDAEDALQDALLRTWRGLPRFEGRSSLRSWLFKVVTNTSLDAAARRPKRVLPLDYGPPADPHAGLAAPLAESVWVEPYPDEAIGLADRDATPAARYELRESLELAFVVALQQLPARQRAVLILREVLGFSAQEVAEMLETTVASVKSALQRARRTVRERTPEESQQATLRALGDGAVREVAERYMDAFERKDVDALVAMLTEDATLAMPPTPTWYSGLQAVAAGCVAGPMAGGMRWRHISTRANGQLALGCYLWDERTGRYAAHSLDVLTLRGDRIAAVTAFHGGEFLSGLGLPHHLSS
jgi:RNA polymerase sigma-70 factor (ECF subfamily)